MTPLLENPLLMFVALVTLYSPAASLPSYFPIVGKLQPAAQRRLALGLFMYVAIFAMVALWVGEPLLEVLGITTAALTATGGIALLYAGVPLMRGTNEKPKASSGGDGAGGASGTDAPPAGAADAVDDAKVQGSSWRSLLLMPVTFPLTVGGTTFAIIVSFRAQANSFAEVVALSVAGLVHASVTGLTLYFSAALERRLSASSRMLLERIAGVLLTAIAVSLLASGGPRMVMETLHDLK